MLVTITTRCRRIIEDIKKKLNREIFTCFSFGEGVKLDTNLSKWIRFNLFVLFILDFRHRERLFYLKEVLW